MSQDRTAFRGIYLCRLDSTRITLPRKFRDIVRDNCGSTLWCQVREDCRPYSFIVLSAATSTNANDDVIRMDTYGRIRLPMALLEKMQREEEKSVVLIGSIDAIDVWIGTEWETYAQEVATPSEGDTTDTLIHQ